MPRDRAALVEGMLSVYGDVASTSNVRDAMSAALAVAEAAIRADEREACAEVAKALDDSRGVGAQIATAIRARGEREDGR